MLTANNACLILTSIPTTELGAELAKILIQEKLAACVQILPAVQSFYFWANELQQAQEHLLLIKTQTQHYQAVSDIILAKHHYELPEIIALPITQGLPAYLEWLVSATKK